MDDYLNEVNLISQIDSNNKYVNADDQIQSLVNKYNIPTIDINSQIQIFYLKIKMMLLALLFTIYLIFEKIFTMNLKIYNYF